MADTFPIAVDDGVDVKFYISAQIKEGEEIREGMPVKLTTDYEVGGMLEIVEATVQSHEAFGIISYTYGYNKSGVFPHQGNNPFHLNVKNPRVSVRLLASSAGTIYVVRLGDTVVKGARVVCGTNGVVTAPSPGTASVITTLGRMLEGGTVGQLKRIFLDPRPLLVS